MKTLYALLTLIILSNAFQANAQVPNGDFETLNYDGSLRNWGNVYLFSISIDTNGNTFTDSIVFDNQFYAPTTDAHSGNYAMELRNAFNYTTGTGIAGSASADTDSVFSAWSGFEMVPFAMQPAQLTFYYKYFPVNNETATAKLQVFDSTATIIGEALVLMTGTISNYTYATAMVNYTSNAPVAYYYLNFSTSSYGGVPPALGTRLLIDDISIPVLITGISKKDPVALLTLFPNPASAILNIDYQYAVESVILRDISGKEISLPSISENHFNCRAVANGIYIATIRTQQGVYTRKVIIQN